MENLLKQLEILRERLLELWRLLDIDRQITRAVELRHQLAEPDVWQDRDKAVRLGQEADGLERETTKWVDLKQRITDLEALVAVAEREDDHSMDEENEAQFQGLKTELAAFEFLVLFSGPYDRNNVIISVHAGTGGVDAQDWAEMLERMYLRFAEKMGWQAEIVDFSPGNEAGIKSVTINLTGAWAYGYLRGDSGVHRLVRISPFDSEGLRHTSFALVEVLPEIALDEVVDIKDEDLEVDTYRASGPGGQNVNKTESAIRIKHKPSGIVVTCQTQRSQHQNRETAMKILAAKLLALKLEAQEKEQTKLKGETQKAEWGKQIRSYVLQPYQMVKDHRTGHQVTDIRAVLDGGISGFAEAYLRANRPS
ncbi:MAG: peptide chain release factor 2 [Candidatus Falkowbacteria bacterium]